MFRAAIVSLIFVATPALATSHYHAQPIAKRTSDRLIVRDMLWNCDDAGCSAAKNHSRPGIVCSALARKVGPLASFSAGGTALPPDELQKCNARAG
ncbi:MAG TPA: hypothetical protein VGD10_00980 [Allosphingosinicella sp.]|uniref:CC_3452 family protein n=1 Tax=Allosphingosinicella sp. TaxID=2823234 RepID=UPI002ED93E7B